MVRFQFGKNIFTWKYAEWNSREWFCFEKKKHEQRGGDSGRKGKRGRKDANETEISGADFNNQSKIEPQRLNLSF